ncbi:MAG: hypothetical protein G01um101466_786 [Parcubacteria group bacterium Gr01-1014_66]|nr:MAG: hypothetical protein G01um101466_786 [Parcubacteria group bacterium Gr01-1014_66]
MFTNNLFSRDFCLGYLFVLYILFPTLLAPNSRNAPLITNEWFGQEKKRLLAIHQNILSLHKPAHWLITKEPQTPEEFQYDISITEMLTRRIKGCAANSQQHPLSQSLKEVISQQGFVVGYLAPPGAVRITMRSLPEPQIVLNKHLFLFYGAHARAIPLIAHTGIAFYSLPHHAPVLPAITFTDPWFCAILLHEFGHRIFRDKNTIAAPAPFLSDPWVWDEILMQRQEGEILNTLTHGAYYRTLQEIWAGYDHQYNIHTFISSLSEAHYMQLNALFPHSSQEEMGLRLGQFIVDITLGWVRTHQDTESMLINTWRLLFALTR